MPLPRCPAGYVDHIFKTSHGVSLPLRLWAAPKAPKPQPWLLWVHGGGYTCGKWSAPTAWISRAFADRGYAVVSVGYRLQPQAGFIDMVEDCTDAVEFCQTNLAKELDMGRWAIGGASSGATVAAMAAQLVEPAPNVFVDVYGLVDPADYYEAERAREVDETPYLVATEEELEAEVRAMDLSKAMVQAPWASEMPPEVSLEKARAALGLPDWDGPSRDELKRNDLYTYVARHRNLMDVIYRRSQFADDESYMAHVREWSPFHRARKTGRFPKTFFMHGTADTIVRVEQTLEMAKVLRDNGIAHEEVYDDGKGHVYDFAFEKPGDEGWEKNVEPCMAFVDKHLK